MIRLGEKQAEENLLSAVQQACEAARISPSQIRGGCIGAAGAARPKIAAKIRSICSEIGLTNLEVVGDTVVAMDAAFGAGPGVIVIAGTGSIAYGRNHSGTLARAGGWGLAISDEGSGHWIGRSAVSAVLDARDREQETTLTHLVLKTWKLDSIDGLVQQANSVARPDFPRLFPVVLQAAGEGEKIAGELLREAGKKLAGLCAIVLRRLAAKSPSKDAPDKNNEDNSSVVPTLPVAMTGSVFRQAAVVRRIFSETLQASFPGIVIRPEMVEPVDGALFRARRLQ